MVVKAYFLGVSVSRIVGLDETANEDRARIALDYKEEREAASRQVPYDIWRVVARSETERAFEALNSYLNSDDTQHRIAVSIGLGTCPNPLAKERLQERLSIETESPVAYVIRDAIEGSATWQQLKLTLT